MLLSTRLRFGLRLSRSCNATPSSIISLIYARNIHSLAPKKPPRITHPHPSSRQYSRENSTLSSSPLFLRHPPSVVTPAPNTSLLEIAANYVDIDVYPSEAVWSLTSLDPNHPECQKALRLTLEARNIDETQFLRWRNALLPSTSFEQAMRHLSHGLIPTPSLFTRNSSSVTTSSSMDDAILRQICGSTPIEIVHAVVLQKLSSPRDIPFALALVGCFGRQPHASMSIVNDMLFTIAAFAIKRSVRSAIPVVLAAVRDALELTSQPRMSKAEVEAHRDSSSRIANDLILSLCKSLRVQGSAAGFPRRLIRSRPARSYSETGTFTTNGAVRTLLIMMETLRLSLRNSTYRQVTHGRTVYLSPSVVRIANRLHRASQPQDDTTTLPRSNILEEYTALARSYAHEGRLQDTVRMIQRIRGLSDQGSRRMLSPTYDKSDSVKLLYNKYSHSPLPPQSSPKGEVLSKFNILLLLAFKNEKRFRDERRFPHAPMSYFLRLQRFYNAAVQDSSTSSSTKRFLQHRMSEIWNMFLAIIAGKKGFPADKLLMMLDSSFKDAEKPHLKLQMPAVTASIHGLVARNEPNAAVMLWKKYATRLERRRSSASQRTSQPDWLLVTAAGQAYAASGRFSDAWDLFHRTSLRDDQDTVELQHGRLMFLTTFIRALSFANRPNVAYALWDSMESCYGVRPDNHTLNVILMTASTHSKPSAAVSLSQQMGWRLRRGSSTISEGAGLDREELFKHIHAELLDQAAPPRRDIGFWWRERPAWQVAREIFREVVLGNWPELVRLEPPVTANPEGYHPLIDWRKLRSSITAQPSSGTVQGISASESHQDVTNDGNVVNPPRILTIPPVSVGKYYDIVPNQRSFDAYIQLLCAHDLIAELPEVLLWARELGILPSHRSLRLGLAYFADIGAAAPFDQAVLGAAGDSPYERLRTWLKEWVPAGYLPTEREIREERALWGTEKDSSMRVEVAKRKRLMNAKYRAARGDLRRKKKGSRWKQALKERLMQGGDTTQRNVTIW